MKNILEVNGAKGTKEELISLFAAMGQDNIPTREELKKRLKEKKEPKIPRVITPKQPKKPSRSYLVNLNPRIAKADRLWRSLPMHERGDLLRAIGLSESEEITELANCSKTPDKVIDWFIMNKNQPKEFHRTITPLGIREVVKKFASFDEQIKTVEFRKATNPTREIILVGSPADVKRGEEGDIHVRR